MAANTADGITYPVSTDGYSYAAQMATLATTTQAALDKRARKPADLAALAAYSGMTSGDLAIVAEGGAIFRYNGTVWVQTTPAVFASASARDTAYAKASAAYRLNTAQVIRSDTGRLEQYFNLYNSSSQPQGAAVAGWYPIAGKPITARVITSTTQSTQATANAFAVVLWSSDLENSGMWSSGAASRVTITQPGLYQITGRFRISNADAYGGIFVSGTYYQKTEQGCTNIATVQTSSTLYLPAGAYVELGFARTGAGASAMIVAGTGMEVTYIGPGSTTSV